MFAPGLEDIICVKMVQPAYSIQLLYWDINVSVWRGLKEKIAGCPWMIACPGRVLMAAVVSIGIWVIDASALKALEGRIAMKK